MKKVILFAFSLLLLISNSYAQNNIQLNIHHKLGEQDFAIDVGAKNNIDHDFNFKRVEYYISEISIIHDGGIESSMKGEILLVDATTPLQKDFGTYDINEVEKIRFHIGVPADLNHLDPSTYPADHPLAPQFPSMHWGWTSGYRFIALEGKASSNFNQIFEFHALGDANYFQTEIEVNTVAQDGQVVIDLDADYARALEDLAVNNGIIVHSEDMEALQALRNFRDYVFSPSGINTATTDQKAFGQIKVFPNPAFDGQAQVMIADSDQGLYEMQVTNVLGQTIASRSLMANSPFNLELEQSGYYLIQFWKEGQLVETVKIVVP